jgi:hypothetical protein
MFPLASENIFIALESSYQNSMSIDVPKKSGKSKELIELISLNMKIYKVINKKFVQFKINPH